MGNIVKFKPDIDYYYTRGLKQYESDNFVDALKNYREAYNLAGRTSSEYRSAIEVEMACCYRNLNISAQTQLMYYKALSDSNTEAAFDSVLGLIDLFGTGGDDEALKYYLDMAAKRGYSRELDFIDAASQFFSLHDYKVEPTPDRNMYELGERLYEAGQFDFARQLLEAIPSDSSSYANACVKLASLYNGSDEYDKALKYALKAEESSPTVEALVNRAYAYFKLGDTEHYNEALNEILSYGGDDINALSHIVRIMAVIGDADVLIKFGRKLSVMAPQKVPMLCYAIALSNKGELREARKMMVTLQALYPYDAQIKAFSVLISRLTQKSDFALTGELPAEFEASILSELNDVLTECADDKALLKNMLKREELKTGILLVLQVGNQSSKHVLAEMVADNPYFEAYIRDCLMNPACPDSDKRMFLPVAIKNMRRRPVYLTVRNICRPLYGKPPVKISPVWKNIYTMAYCAIALFGCENYENRFDGVFNDIRSALISEQDIDETAAAALICNRVKIVSTLYDDECCIELFGADKQKYTLYKKLTEKGGR